MSLDTFFQQPMLVTAVACGLILLCALLVFLLTHRKKLGSSALHSDGERYWEKYKVGKGETVASIAEQANAEWEKIAIVNHLQPPYELKPGETIYIPTGYVEHKNKV